VSVWLDVRACREGANARCHETRISNFVRGSSVDATSRPIAPHARRPLSPCELEIVALDRAPGVRDGRSTLARRKDTVIGTSALVIGLADAALVVAAVMRSGVASGRRANLDVVAVSFFVVLCFVIAFALLTRALTGRSPPPRLRPEVVSSSSERSKDRQAIGCVTFLLLLVHAFVLFRLFG
jgi:hypothetical protein